MNRTFCMALAIVLLAATHSIGRTISGCQVGPESNCPGVNFMGVNLRSVDFSLSNLEDSRMESANLMMTNFTGANLQGVNFQSAELRRANFTDADLRNANFRWSRNIETATFDGADLSMATWSNGRQCQDGSIGTCIFQ